VADGTLTLHFLLVEKNTKQDILTRLSWRQTAWRWGDLDTRYILMPNKNLQLIKNSHNHNSRDSAHENYFGRLYFTGKLNLLSFL